MLATARLIRRSIRAALTTSRHVVSAAVSAHYRLLVHLYRAIDTGATLRIRYTDEDGARTVRDITPRRLDPTQAGNITCRAYDHRDGEDTTFRTDRMQILNPVPEPAVNKPCWNCRQPATHVLTRQGSNTLHACDNCTRIDRETATAAGWTIAPSTHALAA